jgi:phosphoribosyl 1,2-cyclic phosphodiesterase
MCCPLIWMRTFPRYFLPLVSPLVISFCDGNTSPSISVTNGLTKPSKAKSSRILFLGSGSSIGNPMAIYLMQDRSEISPHYHKNYDNSQKAAIGDPRFNKNYRCNPSILIQYRHQTTEETNVVIDAGKTFRESIIRWFPMNKVRSIDAVILTHGHADAILGLDDIRSVQPMNSTKPMPVYLTKECEQVVRKVFFYLFPNQNSDSGFSPPPSITSLPPNLICLFFPPLLML